MNLIWLSALVLLWVAWMLGQPWWRQWQRRRATAPAFPEAWRRILRKRVPAVRRLPADLQLQLKKRIQVFLAEKTFIGCNGLEVSDEMRVTVAAQACLLLLNRGAEVYPDLRQILLYPNVFIVEREHNGMAGLRHAQSRVLSGESWSHGQVILSWQDVLDGAARPDDGRNVVIHEFAHQLDQQAGPANGAPWMVGRERYERWSRVMNEAYARLRTQQQQAPVHGAPAALIDAYGATDPAEFFAVVSEVFFEQPVRLATEQPALYAELAGYYCVDPAAW
jgi:MtfA peptidase